MRLKFNDPMVNAKEGMVEEFVLHRIGAEEGQHVFSDHSVLIKGEEEQEFLRRLFLRPFANMAFTSEFAGGKGHALRSLCGKVHKDKGDAIVELSVDIAKLLLAAAEGRDMPPGEFIVARFSGVGMGNAAHDAVGIFKFDDKDVFLESRAEKGSIALRLKRGLGANKPKKACLVLFTDQEPTLLLIDDQASTEYWQSDFIHARPKKDHVNSTNDLMQLTKSFITEQLPQDFVVEKADQIDLLNRSVDYFKKHAEFDRKEFAEEVFQEPKAIQSFNSYSDQYQREQDVQLQDNFEISAQAVKRQSRVFKSVLKLDKNFHIYIHGDRNKIEQGVDEQGRKFYKIFYEQEA
ncbi:MAG: nucleoid-associated protein [Bacteroidetes bacterium]|nr:nucleoid-associated protein [Bacteroidota bacterium]